jgi:type IV pilus assembly protein PilM
VALVAGIARVWSSPPPSVAVEIAATRVTAVSLGGRRDGRPVASHATEPLPPGALAPSLTADNVVDRAAVSHAVARVLEGTRGSRRVALVIPDAAAKVSVVRFEKVPGRAQDLAQMVRWQVRKAVPFPIDAAQVAFAPAAPVEGGGREYVVVIVRRDVVESYEALVHGAGAQPGLVDLASFNVANLVMASDRAAGTPAAQDWLLVHLTAQASTLAIVRDSELVFYRHRANDSQEPLIDLVHQTAMYYEDRLGGRGFGRVVLAAAGEALAGEHAGLARALEERLRSRVELVDPRRAAHVGPDGAASGEALVAVAAPLGALLREIA